MCMDEYVADYTYEKSISCISENGSVCCAIDKDRVAIVAYGNIRVWNTNTLTVVKEVEYTAETTITAISAFLTGTEEIGFLVGHDNGIVVHIEENGETVSGFRETTKKIAGIVSNKNIGVSFTAGSFSVYDICTESVLHTVAMDIVVSNVSICGPYVVVGSDKGILHKYSIDSLCKGCTDSEVFSLSAQPVCLAFQEKEELWVLQAECLTRVSDSRRIDIKHRVFSAVVGQEEGVLFTKDTKSNYRALRIGAAEDSTTPKLEEVFSFRQTRPVSAIGIAGSYPVLVFADNGVGVYRSAEDSMCTDAGRENLLGLAEAQGVVLGATQNEARIFGRAHSKEELEAKAVSLSLFEEESITCITSQNGSFYIGKENGSVSVKTPLGEETQLLELSSSPITSISALPNGTLAISTDSRVILRYGTEQDEIAYEDEVLCTKLSHDGSLVFSSLADSTVKVHKIDGEHLLTFFGHAVPVVDIEVCTDTQTVFTLGGDKLVKVWGLRHGECRKTLNPGDPTGILLHNNLLLVSTARGLVYYLKDTLVKVKQVEYPSGKKRGTAGQNRLVVCGYYLLSIRERSVSLFKEGEYGTSPEEQAHKEENARDAEEIVREKKIFRLSAIEQLEEAIENDSAEQMYLAIQRLPKTDLHTAIDMMNTQVKDKFFSLLQTLLSGEYNPLFMSWAVSHLLKTGYAENDIHSSQAQIRKKLREYSREARANSVAMQWLSPEDSGMY
ncbi:hypothetical protein NECID01_0811 [Nematocida sp. AWRm77]|nr:hypothetical protein NECID01_0811 [Nematocida sp. AWRm77]